MRWQDDESEVLHKSVEQVERLLGDLKLRTEFLRDARSADTERLLMAISHTNIALGNLHLAVIHADAAYNLGNNGEGGE